MARITVDMIFPLDPGQLFDELTQHERIGEILGVKIRTLSPAPAGAPCGVDSVREICAAPGVRFEETVRSYRPGELMEYQITRGGPVKDHWGRMEFSPHPRGCRLRYTIRFRGRIPGTGPLIALGFRRSLVRALERYRQGLQS